MEPIAYIAYSNAQKLLALRGHALKTRGELQVGPIVTHLENFGSLIHSFRYYECKDSGSPRKITSTG